MQNRTTILVFTILLTLACLYQISFSFVTSGLEGKAESYANAKLDTLKTQVIESGDQFAVVNGDTLPFRSEKDFENVKQIFEQEFLQQKGQEKVYPLLGYSYDFCKKNELNLGLDLQGGMSVTLELSVPDLVDNLSGNQTSGAYLRAMKYAKENSKGNEDFLDNFLIGANENKAKLGMLFKYGNEDSDDFAKDMSNEEVVEVLKAKAAEAVQNTEDIILTRIDRFGVAQPNLSKESSTGRINLELPGVKNKERVRKQLQATAVLEFWVGYNLGELDLYIEEVNVSASEIFYPGARAELDRRANAQANKAKDKVEDEKIEEPDVAEAVIEMRDSVFAMVSPTGDTLGMDSIPVPVLQSADVVDDRDANDDRDNEESTVDNQEVDLDSTGARYQDADGAEQFTDEEIKQYNPLKSRLSLNIVQNQQTGRQQWGQGSIVGVANVKDTADINRIFEHPLLSSKLPNDLKLMWAAKPRMDEERNRTDVIELYALKKSKDGGAEMSGSVVDNASQDFEQGGGRVVVILNMNTAGAQQWADVTSQNVGNSIAITLDNKVYSAPTIQEAITGGATRISGDFSIEEGKDLATLLSAGSLPAKLKIVEESIVGPSLGKDNIQSGLISFIAALIVVLLYMMFYYGKAGMVADVALVANIFFLIGTLASFGAALTLSGIAGIVLTIGMSVDANVLIFERIREEMRAGKGMKLAISDGYSKAYAAIIDANLTTLLTAIVLSIFGSGPIQGFATTLIIGIFTSLFSAIFITRLIFTWMLDKKKNITFDTAPTRNAFTKINFGWLKRRKMYYFISAAIVAGGIGSLATQGLDLGVEFEGGRMIVLEFSDIPDQDALRNAASAQFVDEDGLELAPEVKQKGDSYTLQLTTKYMANSTSDDASAVIKGKLDAALEEMGYTVYADVESFTDLPEGTKGVAEIESRQVDAQISDELMQESILAIVFSLIVIFLYILLRFKKWQFGVGALIAMFHDVLVVLGLFSILYKFMPFTMEINQAFIAAILTVVGYSINDTVVVFDRIREYLGIHKRRSSEEVVNNALNSTLSRTINTSMSTFLVLLIIFLFGGEAIRGFIFALMIGVVVGTYSSLCIATPSAFDLSRKKLTIGDQNEKA